MPIYMKIENVDGEVTAQGYEKWIEVLGFNWGLHQPLFRPGVTGIATARASFQSFNVTKQLDKASPKLFELSAQGKVFGIVKMDIVSTAGDRAPQARLMLKYDNCLVSAWKLDNVSEPNRFSAGLSETVPLEQVGFNYTKVEIVYNAMSTDGGITPIEGSWDLLQEVIP